VPEAAYLPEEEAPVPAARLEMWIEPEVREWWFHTVSKVRLIHAEGVAVPLPPILSKRTFSILPFHTTSHFTTPHHITLHSPTTN